MSESDNKFKILLKKRDSDFKAIMEYVKDIPAIKEKLEATFDEVGELRVDMEVVKNELGLIRHELREKVGKDEFKLLEKRVIFLEKKIVG